MIDTATLAAHKDTNITITAHDLRAVCEPVASDPIAAALIKTMDAHPPTRATGDRYNPLAVMVVSTAHLRHLVERANNAGQTPKPSPEGEATPAPLGPSTAE
jgi:hypothetical protein